MKDGGGASKSGSGGGRRDKRKSKFHRKFFHTQKSASANVGSAVPGESRSTGNMGALNMGREAARINQSLLTPPKMVKRAH